MAGVNGVGGVVGDLVEGVVPLGERSAMVQSLMAAKPPYLRGHRGPSGDVDDSRRHGLMVGVDT